MVGSYSSTKCFCISWMVRHDFPTPPPPTTTSLYSRRNWTGQLADPPPGGVDGAGSLDDGDGAHTLVAIECDVGSRTTA
jgi:hypothetical protein